MHGVYGLRNTLTWSEGVWIWMRMIIPEFRSVFYLMKNILLSPMSPVAVHPILLGVPLQTRLYSMTLSKTTDWAERNENCLSLG